MTQPSIIARQDRAQRVRFRPRTDAFEHARWFTELLSRFLESQPEDWSDLPRLAAQLVIFEGVLTEADLRAALRNLGGTFEDQGRAHLEWLRAGKRQDRRILSSLTATLVAKMPAPADSDIEAAIESLVCWAQSDDLSNLLSAAQAWAFTQLSPWIFSHVTATAPLTAIPASALARRASDLALAAETEAADSSVNAMGAVLDHVLQGRRSKSGPWLVSTLEKVCTQRTKGAARHIERHQKLLACRQLTTELEHADGVSALLLGWAISLMETGGVRGRPVAPSTLRNYIGTVSHALHRALSGKELESMDAADFEKIYREIVDQQSDGVRTQAATALNSWHYFLTVLLDITPIRPLKDGLGTSVPSANVIWPAERARVQAWLADAPENRLNSSLRVAYSIAFNLRIRITELLYLRLNAVLDRGTHIEIHICPGRKDPSVKSESARRIVLLTDASALPVLRAWIQRRQHEHALPNDFVFGDPCEPGDLFRPGAMTRQLSALLKAVTGDRHVSFHTLSHTFVSERVAEACATYQATDINPLEAVSVTAGHRSGATTAEHYTHLFELILRQQLDQALNRITLRSEAASSWTGIKAATLRKRASNNQEPLNSLLWAAVLNAPTPTELPGVQSKHPALVLARKPAFLDETPAPLNLKDVLQALQECTQGMVLQEIASRMDRSEAELQELFSCAQKTLEALLPPRQRGSRPRTIDTVAYLRECLAEKANGLDFSRTKQDKYSSFSEWLFRHETELFESLCAIWPRVYHGHYISLEDAESSNVLLRALKAAEVPAAHLALAIAARNGSDEITQSIRHTERTRAFERVFGSTPAMQFVQPRRGRPDLYLAWTSSPVQPGQDIAAASASIAGFHALMLTAVIWQQLQNSSTPFGTT